MSSHSSTNSYRNTRYHNKNLTKQRSQHVCCITSLEGHHRWAPSEDWSEVLPLLLKLLRFPCWSVANGKLANVKGPLGASHSCIGSAQGQHGLLALTNKCSTLVNSLALIPGKATSVEACCGVGTERAASLYLANSVRERMQTVLDEIANKGWASLLLPSPLEQPLL
eukprot:5944941-Amphidinium_carterae.1